MNSYLLEIPYSEYPDFLKVRIFEYRVPFS
jgi:hypothetical protein